MLFYVTGASNLSWFAVIISWRLKALSLNLHDPSHGGTGQAIVLKYTMTCYNWGLLALPPSFSFKCKLHCLFFKQKHALITIFSKTFCRITAQCGHFTTVPLNHMSDWTQANSKQWWHNEPQFRHDATNILVGCNFWFFIWVIVIISWPRQPASGPISLEKWAPSSQPVVTLVEKILSGSWEYKVNTCLPPMADGFDYLAARKSG